MQLGQRQVLADSDQPWDLIVIGGGITGAGVLLEAARRGQRALLLEQTDFAWGTSSRSSKMVHGGLRYIAQGDVRLTRHSLLERERLLQELPGLVERATYLFPLHKGQFPGRWPMKAVLWLYDFLAGIRDHRYLNRQRLFERVPGLRREGITGAMSYTDALTDDCRLVMRTLLEAARHGGQAINYARVDAVSGEHGQFSVSVRDRVSGESRQLAARTVINATGAWADRLSGSDKRVRPLRGSHLFINPERLPVSDCLTVMHPQDGRPVFVFPWEGVTCVGTTDLDHPQDMDIEAAASAGEVDYLLTLINSQFPQAHIRRDDIYSTIAGVRPVIASGKGVDPSKERRDHAVWGDNGVVTVSGGKLTTFRLIALDALLAAGLINDREHRRSQKSDQPGFTPLQAPAAVEAFLHADQADPAFIDWIVSRESVVHLDDLMLRRTRLGLIHPRAGMDVLERLKPALCQQLGWDDRRWEQELSRYLDIHQRYYGVPAADDNREQAA
ncbi:glycerol-3-phosphate dehydrogenase [Alcanivorax hongdengensis A-11-3]|uniref:Glycerol-3-phosphate dehydrogenase n=1 Tax=Alcanivorax hongdengensis A-11-3 TaxID=1177179 RepID=L0WAQ1_9GAMM|nr:glycerol-3-phosphate dehydrogenase/oxidase [Alcanivorax hongdengensis]EKF74079.1 glycerol-3-phosphate dehydrogenase [Alcanivorax hongdengensis A-11-3]